MKAKRRMFVSPAPWLGPALAARVEVGDPDALLRAVALYAKACVERGGGSLALRPSMLDVAGGSGRTPEQRALLAVASDLLDLIAHAPQGRKALLDLGLEPVPQDDAAD